MLCYFCIVVLLVSAFLFISFLYSYVHFLSLVFVIYIKIFLLLLGVLFSLSFMSSCDSLEEQRVHFTLLFFSDSLLFVIIVVVVSLFLIVVICIEIFLPSPCLVCFFLCHITLFFLLPHCPGLFWVLYSFTSLLQHLSSSLSLWIVQH